MPQISIIVPVYKTERYLDICVQSILTQAFVDFELILVNDGSPDNCPQICDEWAVKDKRVKVIHKDNGSLRSAVLAGLKSAQGEYTGFVDSDDWVSQEMFKVLFEAAEQNGADLVECGYICTGSGPDEKHGSPCLRILNLDELKSNVLPQFFDADGKLPYFTTWSRWNKLYKTTLLQTAMQDSNTRMQLGEDCAQLCAYLPLCRKVVILKGEYLYYYRRNQDSLTMDYSGYSTKKYEPYFTECIAFAQKYGYTGDGFAAQRDRLLSLDALGVVSSGLDKRVKREKLKDILCSIKERGALLELCTTQFFFGKAAAYALYFGLGDALIFISDIYYRCKLKKP